MSGWGWEDEVDSADEAANGQVEGDEAEGDTEPEADTDEPETTAEGQEITPPDEPGPDGPEQSGPEGTDVEDVVEEATTEEPEEEVEAAHGADAEATMEQAVDEAEAQELDPSPDVTPTGDDVDESPESAAGGGGIATAGGDAEIGDLDTSHLAPDALTTAEAAQKGHRWKIMVWGPPGLFKTHFAWTMPQPVVIIDTEGKAHDIAHKFDDRVTRLFQPSNYDEAVDALHKGTEILEYFRDETGAVGTIVVDSMSIMWEWAQQKYVDEWYPGKESVADVEFKSAMQTGGAGDWKQIKRYHNEDFREVMLNTDFHLCWTAMETEDYEAVFSGETESTPMKPAGEKNNVFKVDHIIRARRDGSGVPVGDLQKSGLVRHGYRGLPYPTFDKHETVVSAIAEAEDAPDPVPVDEITEYDVEITEGVIQSG